MVVSRFVFCCFVLVEILVFFGNSRQNPVQFPVKNTCRILGFWDAHKHYQV